MRLLIHAQPMRHESVKVRFQVQDGSTKTGVGHWHVMMRWWRRIRPALERAFREEEIPFEVIEEAAGSATVSSDEDPLC